MTQTEINELVAGKVMEWKREARNKPLWHTGGPRIVYLPDFSGSLDDCRDAEERIPVAQRIEYRRHLQDVINPLPPGLIEMTGLIYATALQRCLAMLRLYGVESESQPCTAHNRADCAECDAGEARGEHDAEIAAEERI